MFDSKLRRIFAFQKQIYKQPGIYQYLLNALYIPDSGVTASFALAHLIHTSILRGGCYDSHFIY